VQRFASAAWEEAKGPLYRNAIFLMLSSIIGIGLGFVFTLIVLRLYTENDVGYALTIVNTLSFLGGIATLGLGVGLIRFLPESESPTALVNTCLSIAGALAIVLALVFTIGIPLWLPDISFVLESPIYIVAVVLTAMLYAFAPLLDQSAIAVRRADAATARTVVFSVVKIPLPLVFAVFLTGPLGGRLGVFLSITLSFGVSVLVAAYVLLPRVIPGFRPRPRLSRRRLKPIFSFSIGNGAAGIIGSAAVLLQSALVLTALPGSAADSVAHFYAASILAGLLYIIPNATMTSFLAEASQANARRRRDETMAILLSLGLLVPGIIGLYVLAPWLLGLFNRPGYVTAATTPLRILAFASIPVFLNGLLATRVRIQKRSWPLIAAAAIESVVTLGLGYALLQSIGLVGLAYAFVLGQAAATPLLFATGRGSIEEEPLAPEVPPQAGT
jgi:O-antigen/teichoic acid export membrane protein